MGLLLWDDKPTVSDDKRRGWEYQPFRNPGFEKRGDGSERQAKRNDGLLVHCTR